MQTQQLSWLWVLIVLVGCQSSQDRPVKKAPTAAQRVPKPAAAPSDVPPKSTRRVHTDAQGRKWIDDIPYDVFFDDPLAIASNTQTVVPADNPTMSPSAASSSSDTPPPTQATHPSASHPDWKTLITLEQLQEETKRIRNHLAQSLQTQATYNNNYKELRSDGAVIAAIARVAPHVPGELTWKSRAAYLEEYGRQLNESATGLGREAYTRSQAWAEKIETVLSGSLPADPGEAPADRPLSQVVSRTGVMVRMMKARDWMKLELNTESRFQAEKEKAYHEASVAAMLGQIVADHSYDYADEDDYKRHVQAFIDSGRTAAAAAQEGSFEKFSRAINAMQQACDQCHASYVSG
ncbi:MAG: hypothetical protein KatS3mg114_1289 [Planctomycetaceae bacterium]|nr:MAG: hypothetical protein KatS3mg114_1289 [Planctomycetaceae bacterium]